MSDSLRITRAFNDAQKRRPYKVNKEILAAATPGGGDWSCVARVGDITRTVIWGPHEVAIINPRGDMSDQIEGQIAMAIAKAPVMDCALRSIMVLAESPDNLELIRKLAETVIAAVEQLAPAIVEPEDR